MATWKSYIEGPRFAGIGSYLRQLAMATGVEITKDHEKGWIREIILFEVSGESGRIQAFSRVLSSTIREYNKD